ncbi:UNVERIFIED_CONTAM: putative mitochondrial protein [Sesamum latifolium]|uniref:Mitochondrial protein n=1 Tax=Sesamum latifolium TaxID=2727402 RepID=A0AAW2VVT7_9LAMI
MVTTYFHSRASARHKKNAISRLRNREGSWCVTGEEIQDTILDHFETQFRSSNPREEAISAALERMQAKVSADMNLCLTSQMYPYKSPGPDGMFHVFFQKYWHIVSPEVTSFILDFLNNRHFDPKFNYTYIVVIPKCPNPEHVTQFGPISLCNISYKIASMMIANRLKPFMNDIISESQSAFVLGRLITDSILVAYEINHYLAHKHWGSVGHVALKLDLTKAYDRVEWIFLERVLAKLGFHDNFISLIWLCISTVSYSIMLIDDTLIFCQASKDELESVKHVLRRLEAASGLTFNLDKSSMTFSKNTQTEGWKELAEILDVQIVEKHNKYLGLPSSEFIASGTLVLIQTVISAMPTFAMNYFLLPLSTCREIESMMADFLWHNKEQRRVHWVAWDKLCSSKKDGGLGFRILHLYNQALVAKQLWRVISKTECLMSQLLKHKYFPTSDALSAQAGPSASFIWRGILATRHLIQADSRWQIGNGQSVNIEGRWNEKLIKTIFVAEDAEAIMNTSITGGVDTLLWHYELHGSFTTRSAFQLACRAAQRESSECGESSSASRLIGILYGQLECRLSEQEDIMHCLLRCSFPRQVWALSHLCWSIISQEHSNPKSWLRGLHGLLARENFDRALLYAGFCGVRGTDSFLTTSKFRQER